jgi:hypothetical protein
VGWAIGSGVQGILGAPGPQRPNPNSKSINMSTVLQSLLDPLIEMGIPVYVPCTYVNLQIHLNLNL